MKRLLLFALLLSTIAAHATVRFANSAATGSANGSTWANGYVTVAQINSAMSGWAAGDTLCIAAGTYTTSEVFITKSGTSGHPITFKRALASDAVCGSTTTGWSSAFDGLVTMTGFLISHTGPATNFITIDGSVANGMFMQVPNVSGSESAINVEGPSDHVTITNVEIGQAGCGASGCNQNGDSRAIDMNIFISGNYALQSNWLVDHAYLHGQCTIMWAANSSNLIVQNTKFADSIDNTPGNPNCHPNVFAAQDAASATFRYNEVVNWEVEGFLVFNTNASAWDIYGNVWHDPHSGSFPRVFEAQQDPIGPVHAYNNTFINIPFATFTTANSGSYTAGSAGLNNIYISSSGSGLPSNDFDACNGSTCGETHGQNIATSIFVNFSAGTVAGYALASNTATGSTLASPFNTDLAGTTRGANGVWDRGYFQIPASGSTVATPTCTPAAGSYPKPLTVSCSTVTAGATICATTDGTTPTATTPGTCSHGTAGPFTLTANATVNAIGTLVGSTNSVVAPFAYTLTSRTVASVTLSPGGAILQSNTGSINYVATVRYTDGAIDTNCASPATPGFTWTTPSQGLNLTSSGVATWNPSFNPYNISLYPSGAFTAQGKVHVVCGGVADTANILAESSSGTVDTFYLLITPWALNYTDVQTGTPLNPQVVVGSTVTLGVGFSTQSNFDDANPAQPFMNYTSSNTAIATVTRYGLVTAVGTGDVTITATPGGNGVFGTSTSRFGLDSYFNPIGATGGSASLKFTVTGPTPSSQTWYVRPNGGTPYVSAGVTPTGQCDGKGDADYVSGVNQHCAMGNLSYLWNDQVTANQEKWMIHSGDTVIVRAKSGGYNIGMLARSLGNGGSSNNPVNCSNSDCYMPTLPSGTGGHPTQLLGECSTLAGGSGCSDSADILLNMTWAQKAAINLTDTQFFTVEGFKITSPIVCAHDNSFSIQCAANSGTLGDYGSNGVNMSALTASGTLKNIWVYGPAFDCFFGALGANVIWDHLHAQGCPDAGVNMDDAPYGQSNISVSDGPTMTNSIIEWAGAMPEKPAVHQYPYVELRDQSANGYGDGYGTASTTGTWSFDHDIFRYNLQDGLDLLHSNMQVLNVTNSQSFANEGNQFKIGAADTSVLFQNNTALANCARVLFPVGDEPSGAVAFLSSGAMCRAGGDPLVIHFNNYGTYIVQSNSLNGYGDVTAAYACESGSENCSGATTVYQNNVSLNLSSANAGGATNGTSATFCPLNIPLLNDCNGTNSHYPANQGWGTRTNNWYYNSRSNPTTILGTEHTTNPFFNAQPGSLTIGTGQAAEAVLDPSPAAFGSALTGVTLNAAIPSVSSPLLGAGVAYAGIPGTDLNGVNTTSPPVVGAMNYTATPTVATPVCSPGAGTYTSTQTVTCGTITPSAVICATTDGSTPAATGGSCTNGTGGPFTIATTTTLKAIGALAGDTNSAQLTNLYTINPPPPPTNLIIQGISVMMGIAFH